MRLARATLARCTGAATEPEAVRAGRPAAPAAAPAAPAGAGRTSVTRRPSSRNASLSGNSLRRPCRSSSVTASFSQDTTAPQKSPAESSTTRPYPASIRGSGSAPNRRFSRTASWSYCLLRTTASLPPTRGKYRANPARPGTPPTTGASGCAGRSPAAPPPGVSPRGSQEPAPRRVDRQADGGGPQDAAGRAGKLMGRGDVHNARPPGPGADEGAAHPAGLGQRERVVADQHGRAGHVQVDQPGSAGPVVAVLVGDAERHPRGVRSVRLDRLPGRPQPQRVPGRVAGHRHRLDLAAADVAVDPQVRQPGAVHPQVDDGRRIP